MARVRYVGSEPVTVPELGDLFVEPDTVVEVPDDRFEGYVCQPTNWESVEEPGVRAAVEAKKAARAAKGADL
jgi:hypothetical protein